MEREKKEDKKREKTWEMRRLTARKVNIIKIRIKKERTK